MKSIQARKNPSLRTIASPYSSDGLGFHQLRERGIDAVTWFAIVAIVVVYAVMAVALYRWSVYAPVFQPDSEAAAEQAFPWPQ